MILAGYPWNVILRVKNNTERLIDEVKFYYNDNSNGVNIKKIKSNENKQTGISTLNDINNLKMKVVGIDKSYIIKDFIKTGDASTIIISINSLEINECIFNIKEGE